MAVPESGVTCPSATYGPRHGCPQYIDAGLFFGRGGDQLWIGGGVLADIRQRGGEHLIQLARFQLVGFRQHQLIGHRRFVHQRHGLAIIRLYAMPAVDQQEHARELGASAQIVLHQPLPALHQALRRPRVAIAGHVDDMRGIAHAEIVQLAGAARRVRGARELALRNQCVEQARLADIGPPGERHLRQRLIRQPGDAHHALHKSARQAEELLGLGGVGFGLFGFLFHSLFSRCPRRMPPSLAVHQS